MSWHRLVCNCFTSAGSFWCKYCERGGLGVVQQARIKQGRLSSNQLGAGAPRAFPSHGQGWLRADGVAAGGHGSEL